MDRRDSYEDKHLLYSQAARKAHCWGCCRARVWRFLNRLSTRLPRKQPYFSENPLILSSATPRRLTCPSRHSFFCLSISTSAFLRGIDPYGSNLRLINRSVASSLQTPGCSVGDLSGERPNPDAHATVPVDKPTFNRPDDPIS